jgi:hypothetical protein
MTDWTFDRDAISAFRFVRCDFDPASGVASLAYAFDDGPELVETVSIPGAPFALDDARAAAVERALRLLHLIAGVSYYKAAVPAEIRIDGYAIDAGTAAMLQSLYRNGLGEFAYRNGIELAGRIRFPGDRGPGTGDQEERAPGLLAFPGPRSPVPAQAPSSPSAAARTPSSPSKPCARSASRRRCAGSAARSSSPPAPRAPACRR